VITKLIGGLCLFYIFFRLTTSLIIPKITQRKIQKFQERYKQQHPEIFKSEDTKQDNDNK